MSNDEDQEQQDDPQHTGALTTAPTRAGQVARQDFSGTQLSVTNAATEALVASARANTEARWIMAMRNPRNMLDVREEILKECKRPGFADVATYARPVGREKDKETGEWKEVFAEGLSIRFAEVAMRRMRNMQCKATTVYDDQHTRVLTVYAVDYETNSTWETDVTVKKTVERRQLKKGQRSISERINSYGDRVYIVEATDDEVKTKAAAEVSKASRTAILRLIPGEIQDEAFETCKRVAADKAAKDPQAAVKRMLDAFSDLGVRPSEVEQWLGCPIASGHRDSFVQLSKIAAGIREGELVWATVLEERIADRAAAKPKPAAQSATSSATPAQPATQPATPTTNGNVVTSAARDQPAASKPTSSGKGTGALRSALKAVPKEEPAQGGRKATELPPDTEPPASGNEYRHCAKCDVIMEVPIADPAGGKCYACRAAESDE